MAALACIFPRTRLYERVREPFSLMVLVLGSPMLIYAVELLSYGSVIYMRPRILISNILIILGAGLLIGSVLGRLWIGTLFVTAFSRVAGLANHFTILYRGSAISPVDLFAIRSAAAVVSHYSFSFDMPLMIAIAVFVRIAVFAVRYRSTMPKGKAFAALRGIGAAAGLGALVFSCTHFSSDWNGMYIYMKEYTESARRNGMIYNFVQARPTLRVKRPEGYSPDEVRKMSEKYVDGRREETQRPDVVMVMMETWSDFSDFTNTSFMSRDPQEYLHMVRNDDDPNTLTGHTVVPVYGSGTCNTEFEAVTGFSMRNFDANSYPYLQYVTRGTPSMASYLSALGYHTTALHPGIAETWNRKSVYPWLGFENSRFDSDFINKGQIHELISDRSCFDEILSCLPADGSGADPQFIFTVTISNHGGYRKNPDFDIISSSGKDQTIYLENDVYSSLLRYTSDDLEYFIGELSKRERPTIVIFWGDHLPALNSEYLDVIHFESIVGMDPLTKYTTPYMVWSNFDIDQSEIPQTMSSNYLGVAVLKMSGLPVNGWYRFLEHAMKTAPVYSVQGDVFRDGVNTEDRDELLREYEYIQYAAMKDRDSLAEGFFEP